jgi:hypothetical protein
MARQEGIVSIIATIVFGLLASIFAISSVALQASEVRQAQDIDQSVKAYYAANAGVEDALLKVRNGVIPAAPVCDKYDLINNNSGSVDRLGYTCQIIETRTPRPTGVLEAEQSVEFEVPASRNLGSMTIRWHLNNQDTPSPLPPVFNNTASGDFGSLSSWNAPAAMEVMDIHFNATATSSEDISVKNVIIRPRRPYSSNTGSIIGNVSQDARCQPSAFSGYDCEMTLTSFNSQTSPVGLSGARTHIIRIRPRYVGTHYQVEFRNTGGITIDDIDTPYATIDVTGKSGDVYRRIRARVPVRGSVASGLDYVLFSDTDICKNFRVRDVYNTGRGGAEQAGPGSVACPFAPFTP